jgi:hypothetical protein
MNRVTRVKIAPIDGIFIVYLCELREYRIESRELFPIAFYRLYLGVDSHPR